MSDKPEYDDILTRIPLLPCPHCGSTAELKQSRIHAPYKFYVECSNEDCRASSGYDLGWSGAAELWNRRVEKDDYWTLHNSPPKHETEVQQ